MSNSTEINQQYFNKIASDYEKRYAGFDELARELKEHVDFIGIKEGGRLLDYACGTGLVTRSLFDAVSQAIGVDIAENMVGAYNAKGASENIPEDKRKAYVGNLLSEVPSPSLDGSLFRGFDAAGVGAGFHHFEDTTLAATRLAERLVPGGSLFILDFAPHDISDLGDIKASHGVHHAGFSEEGVRKLFEAAGAARDFKMKMMQTEFVANHDGKTVRRKFFLARGTKTTA